MSLSPEYFRKLIKEHTNSLRTSCKHWNKEISFQSNLSEEIIGDINVATGQSELLIQERFTQFETLICDCELKRGEKETTLQDLQGFWDIIFIQVENINQRFVKLEEVKKNNWVYPSKSLTLKKPSNSVLKRKPLSTIQNQRGNSNGTNAAKSSIRDHILAARKKMKSEMPKGVQNVVEGIKELEVTKEEKENKKCLMEVNVTPPSTAYLRTEEKKSFNAGFFKVETPIRSHHLQTRAKFEDGVKNELTPKMLSSTALKKQMQSSPIIHKDYSPFMRITRSMKTRMTPVQLNIVDVDN